MLPGKNSIILENPLFRNNSIELYSKENLGGLPHQTLQMNEVQPNPTENHAKAQFSVGTVDRTTIAPQQQKGLKCNLLSRKLFSDMCRILEPKVSFEDKTGLCITSSSFRTGCYGNLFISVLNLQNNVIAIPRSTAFAIFRVLSPQRAETLTPIDPQLLRLPKLLKSEHFVTEENQLNTDQNFSSDSQRPEPKPE